MIPNELFIYGLLPLRLIADVSDGLDDSLIGDVAFDGGGASSEVNSHLIDALQALHNSMLSQAFSSHARPVAWRAWRWVWSMP